MIMNHKKIEDLVPADLQLHPVWEFANEQEDAGDTLVRPVDDIPVRSLANRVVGTEVRIANGEIVWAMLGNLDLTSVERTQHFRTMSIFRNARWFFLARYHDHDYETHGPSSLAAFLGLRKEDIFPIVYDVRYCCIGDPNVIVDAVAAEPIKRLTQTEIISLSIP